MQRLLLLVFLLPWWAYFPLAGGLAYYGQQTYKEELVTQAANNVALTHGPPPVVELSAFDPALHVSTAGEVQVLGWINSDYNATLAKRTNGVRTGDRYLYLLFGLADGEDTPTVRAAMLLSDGEREDFIEHLENYIAGYKNDAPVFHLGGIAVQDSPMAETVATAIAQQGLLKADGFFYLEPFLKGREAALVVEHDPENRRQIVWGIGLVLALIGLVKKMFGFGKRRPNEALTPPDVGLAVSIEAPGGADKPMNYDHAFQGKKRPVGLANTVSPDSPLGRMAYRDAPPAEPAQDPVKAIGVAPPPKKPGRTSTNPRRPVGLILMGLVLVVAGVSLDFGFWTADILPRQVVPFARPPILATLGAAISILAFKWPSIWGRRASAMAPRASDLSGMRAPTARVDCDMRDRMRADPFDRFAQEVRGSR